MKHLVDLAQVKRWSPSLYSYTFPLTIMGAQFGRRMIIVKAPDNRLLLLSPLPIHDYLSRDLAPIGRVDTVVYPTVFHDTQLTETRKYLKNKDVYACPGFDRLPRAKPIDELPEKWANILDWQLLEGMPKVNEIVFYHKKTNTLLPSDLLFNFTPEYSLWTRLLAKASAIYPELQPSRLFKMNIKDRPAFMASLAKILAWDFQTILPSHADPIGPEGRQALEKFLQS